MSEYQFLNANQISLAEWNQLAAMLEAFYNTESDLDQMPIRPNPTGKSWISTRIPNQIVTPLASYPEKNVGTFAGLSYTWILQRLRPTTESKSVINIFMVKKC